MYENYFTTLRNLEDMSKAETNASNEYCKLQYDGYLSWCSEDPELDELRKNAMRALEDYRDAIVKRSQKLTDRLFDKLEDSDKVLNLKNLFKT